MSRSSADLRPPATVASGATVAEPPTVPLPATVGLPAAVAEAMLADLAAALPNEGCGLIAGDRSPFLGGSAVAWLPTRNRLASPYRFEIEPEDLLRAQLAIDDASQVVWAVVHSHVASEARPSPSDVRAAVHPAALHLVVSFAAAGPEVRAWRIRAGEVVELALALEAT